MKKEENKIIEILKRDYLYTDIFIMICKLIIPVWIITDIFLCGFYVASQNKTAMFMIIIVNILILFCFLICLFCHKLVNRVYFDRLNKINKIEDSIKNNTEISNEYLPLYNKYKVDLDNIKETVGDKI